MDIKGFISNLFVNEDDPESTRNLAFNTVYNNLNHYMMQLFDRKLKFGCKGFIFCCVDGNTFATRYIGDFEKILYKIGYRLVACNPEPGNVDEYLKERLKESLPTEVEQSKGSELEGGVAAGPFSIKGSSNVNTRTTHKPAETLIGLIENNLQERNLMLVIINADDIDFQGLKGTINDVFAAGGEERRAALTLVSSNNHWLENWYIFEPQKVVKEKKLIDLVWAELSPKQRELFQNKINVLKRYLSKSQGSTGKLREIWYELWDE